jgi:hypothetical protein
LGFGAKREQNRGRKLVLKDQFSAPVLINTLPFSWTSVRYQILDMGERTRELLLLILGDIFFFIIALWLTLFVRYLSFPSIELFANHLGPFLTISTVWLFIFYVAGLYDKQTIFFKSLMFSRILNTQVVNGIIAALLFFVIPFGIAPKTNLVIYLFISVAIFTWWRMYLYRYISPKNMHRAIILADGPEVIELVDEVNNNDRYNYSFIRIIDKKTATETVDFETKLFQLIEKEKIEIIVVNTHDQYIAKVLPKLFDLAFLRFELTFLDFYKVYEDTFDRVPLSSLSYEWFITHVSQSKSLVYDAVKRVIDIIGSLFLGLILLMLLPFIYLAMRLEGKGDLFIVQERVGQFNKTVTVYKIRTMTENRSASATWTNEDAKEGNVVTRVGAIFAEA